MSILGTIVLALVIFKVPAASSAPAQATGMDQLKNGTKIICKKEAYNCPSYSGQHQERRLTNCEDVDRVFAKCGIEKDPHGLDSDNDGYACDIDCGDATKIGKLR